MFIDSYDAARKKLPLAYDTDGLQSDKEMGRGSRKRKAPQNFSFDDEMDGIPNSSSSKKPKKTAQHSRKLTNRALPAPPKITTQSKSDCLVNTLISLKGNTSTGKSSKRHSSSTKSKGKFSQQLSINNAQ